jgi:hypothetical protein
MIGDLNREVAGASVAIGCGLDALAPGGTESARRARWLLEQASHSGWRDPATSVLAVLGVCTALADAVGVAVETADQAHAMAVKKASSGPSPARVLGPTRRDRSAVSSSTTGAPSGARGPGRRTGEAACGVGARSGA